MDELIDLSWADIGFEETDLDASNCELAVVPFATPSELAHSRSLTHTAIDYAEDPFVSPVDYLAQHEAIQEPPFHTATIADITAISTDDQPLQALQIHSAKRSSSLFVPSC
jgi:hypothetical protein